MATFRNRKPRTLVRGGCHILCLFLKTLITLHFFICQKIITTTSLNFILFLLAIIIFDNPNRAKRERSEAKLELTLKLLKNFIILLLCQNK